MQKRLRNFNAFRTVQYWVTVVFRHSPIYAVNASVNWNVKIKSICYALNLILYLHFLDEIWNAFDTNHTMVQNGEKKCWTERLNIYIYSTYVLFANDSSVYIGSVQLTLRPIHSELTVGEFGFCVLLRCKYLQTIYWNDFNVLGLVCIWLRIRWKAPPKKGYLFIFNVDYYCRRKVQSQSKLNRISYQNTVVNMDKCHALNDK